MRSEWRLTDRTYYGTIPPTLGPYVCWTSLRHALPLRQDGVKKLEKRKRFSPRRKIRKANKEFILCDSSLLGGFVRNSSFFPTFHVRGRRGPAHIIHLQSRGGSS